MQRENWSKERKLKTTQNKSKRGKQRTTGWKKKVRPRFWKRLTEKYLLHSDVTYSCVQKSFTGFQAWMPMQKICMQVNSNQQIAQGHRGFQRLFIHAKCGDGRNWRRPQCKMFQAPDSDTRARRRRRLARSLGRCTERVNLIRLQIRALPPSTKRRRRDRYYKIREENELLH